MIPKHPLGNHWTWLTKIANENLTPKHRECSCWSYFALQILLWTRLVVYYLQLLLCYYQALYRMNNSFSMLLLMG